MLASIDKGSMRRESGWREGTWQTIQTAPDETVALSRKSLEVKAPHSRRSCKRCIS